MTDTIPYPGSPARIPASIFSPSADFRKEVLRVTGNIVLFLLTYLLLVIAALALAIGCLYLGVQLIILLPKFITLMIGLGIMALGISVVIFLVKFVFATARDVNDDRIQVTEAEQPILFAFIRRLTKETGTPFPKKIFISPQVNACVFYDSSFLSLFVPTGKNLEIGLGLVNSVNVGEFKAVMAHEFGHFSQRSMKLGSFTYQVNRIIYNMLYDNKGYTNFLNGWGNIHGAMSVFAGLTVKIATGIQWVLKQMYQVVNKSYMGLSRQMEFHADAIAAGVSGGNNLITALQRLDLAQSSYSIALQKAEEHIKQNKVSGNFFANQQVVMLALAKEFELPVENGLPMINSRFLQSLKKSRVNYKNQWASHPSIEERETHLQQLGITVSPSSQSAWILFTDAAALQQKATQHMYRHVKTEQVEVYGSEEFTNAYTAETDANRLPIIFKGYYDGRYIQAGEWNEYTMGNTAGIRSFTEIFSVEHCALGESIRNNESDADILKAIGGGNTGITSFDLDGVKYGSACAADMAEQLLLEVVTQRDTLDRLDQEAYQYFLQKATATGKENELKEALSLYKRYSAKENAVLDISKRIFSIIIPFYQQRFSFEYIWGKINGLRQNEEPAFKRLLESFVIEGCINLDSGADLYRRIQVFTKSDFTYLSGEAFNNSELETLRSICIDTAEWAGKQRFNAYKALLEKQAGFIKN